MIQTYIKDYLWGTEVKDINLHNILNECFVIKDFVNKKFEGQNLNERLLTTWRFEEYNVFHFAFQEVQNLYKQIKNIILPFLDNKDHVIQCWVNFIEKGENLNWHKHWEKEFNVIHGFFCVLTELELSYTEYKFEHEPDKIYKIDSKDGLLVFGKSAGDVHRTSMWGSDNPRVTIAFDIIPIDNISNLMLSNELYIRGKFVPFF